MALLQTYFSCVRDEGDQPPGLEEPVLGNRPYQEHGSQDRVDWRLGELNELEDENHDFERTLPQVTVTKYGPLSQQTPDPISRLGACSFPSSHSYGDASTSQGWTFSTPPSQSDEEVCNTEELNIMPTSNDSTLPQLQDNFMWDLVSDLSSLVHVRPPSQGASEGIAMQDFENFLESPPMTLDTGMEAPWTSHHPNRAQRYDSACPYHGPGPSNVGAIDMAPHREATVHSTRVAHQSVAQTSVSKQAFPAQGTSKKGRKRALKQWEDIAVREGGAFAKMIVPKRGQRHGPLNPKQKEETNNMRHNGACFSCHCRRVKCTNKTVCKHCLHRGQECFRGNFNFFLPALFPDFLFGHLHEKAVRVFQNQHFASFYGAEFEVELFLGACFDLLKLPVKFFRPVEESDIEVHHHLKGPSGSQLVLTHSAPISLISDTNLDVQDILEPYMKSMTVKPAYIDQITAGDVTSLPWCILQAATEYWRVAETGSRSNEDLFMLPGEACALHGTIYAMRALLTFSPASAASLGPAIDGSTYESSRLLNRQIKAEVVKLSKKLAEKVLSGLEKSLKSRNTEYWGTSFCAMLILCQYMDCVQIAANTLVAFSNAKDGKDCEYSRRDSQQACEVMDQFPFAKLNRMFHEAWKSYARKDAFNPLRDKFEGRRCASLDRATDELVQCVCQIIRKSDILAQADNTALADVTDSDVWTDVAATKIRFNGECRLVGRFLGSFL